MSKVKSVELKGIYKKLSRIKKPVFINVVSTYESPWSSDEENKNNPEFKHSDRFRILMPDGNCFWLNHSNSNDRSIVFNRKFIKSCFVPKRKSKRNLKNTIIEMALFDKYDQLKPQRFEAL